MILQDHQDCHQEWKIQLAAVQGAFWIIDNPMSVLNLCVLRYLSICFKYYLRRVWHGSCQKDQFWNDDVLDYVLYNTWPWTSNVFFSVWTFYARHVQCWI